MLLEHLCLLHFAQEHSYIRNCHRLLFQGRLEDSNDPAAKTRQNSTHHYIPLSKRADCILSRLKSWMTANGWLRGSRQVALCWRKVIPCQVPSLATCHSPASTLSYRSYRLVRQ